MDEQQTDHGKAIDGLLYRIESKSNTDTVNSLKRINKFLKKEECRDVFVEKEGIKRLISRLETGLRQNEGGSSSATTDVKLKNDIIELILCALIKVTLKEEACKEKICVLGGLKILENILVQVSKESIIKSCCSLIIILSSDTTVSFIRNSPGLIPTLVNILPIYEDKLCSIAILRCLWSVCSDEQSILRALSAIGFPSVVKMLDCEQARLAKATLKVLYKFLRPNIDFVGYRILDLDGLKSLLSLQKRMSDDDEDGLNMISDCLYFMALNPRVIVSVCATDFIESCTQELSNKADSRRFKNALLSLCLCAMEAMNRVRMRMSGALERLVRLLGDSKYSQFHSQIISTFICFLFDDLSLDVMLQSSLLLHLCEYFARIVKLRAEKGQIEIEKDLLIGSDAGPSSVSSPGQTNVNGAMANLHGARGIFQDVILILSKLSRTRAVKFMVHDCCIDPLLDYMRTSIHHDQKAEKILSRIVENPLFFELLLKLGIAQSIYCQLISGISIKNLGLEIEKVLSQHSGEEENSAGLDTSSISFENLFRMNEYTTPASVLCNEPSRPNMNDPTVNEEEEIHVETEESSNVLDPSRKLPSPETIASAKSLIRTLVLQATSPFGQGVLTHGLLSDSNVIKESFTMAFCFLCSCRSPKFLRKVFVELGGLSLLSSLLRKSNADDMNFLHAVLAFHGLAKAIALDVDNLNDDCEPEMSNGNGKSYFSPCKKLKLDEDAAQESESNCCILSTLFHSSQSKSGPCLNGNQTPIDSKEELVDLNSKNQNICFRVEECVNVTVDREVITSASPVFAAMLSSNFLDSSLPFISIRDAYLSSFLILVHHVYGCSIDLDTFACADKCLYKEDVRVEETELGLASESKDIEHRITNLVKYNSHVNSKKLTERTVMRKPDPNHPRCCCSNGMPPKQAISLIIETLRISDRFLIDDLKMKCEKNLARHLLNDTVGVIYIESVRCQAKLLSTHCVKYLLVKMWTLAAYVSAATNILLSSEKDQFIDDLEFVLRKEIMEVKQPF